MIKFLAVVKIRDNIVDYMKLFYGPNGVLQKGSNSGKSITTIAEEEFVKIAKEIGFTGTDEDMDDHIDNGYYEGAIESVCISWPDSVG